MIKSQPGMNSNSHQQQPLTAAAPGQCTTGCTREHGYSGPSPDPELAALVAAWPTLPPHIRAAVGALVATVIPPTPLAGPSGGG